MDGVVNRTCLEFSFQIHVARNEMQISAYMNTPTIVQVM